MTSIGDQTVQQLGGQWSILTRQKQDHIKLERLLGQIPGASGDALEDLLRRVSRLVFSHAFAEEAVLWPAIRRLLPDGDVMTTRVEREHQEITEVVARLSKMQPDDPSRRALLDRAVALLRQDVRDEEDELLPRLQDAATTTDLRRLGITWELIRRTAPTRAHPIVARRPPGNTLAALPLSVLDRSRDGLDHLSRRAAGGRLLRSASRGLGGVAHRVEHLPWMRRGERPETHTREHRP